jgi:hypothetical protein
MQSSSVVTFRALIMLGCLVAVPMVAAFRTSLPDAFHGLLAGQWPGDSDLPQSEVGDAPRFEPVMPGDMASVAPPRRMPPTANINRMPPTASPLPAAMPRVVPVGYEAPIAAEPVDRFTYVQDRLKQLGATYYLLEMFEGREEQYRFHCCIPVGGNLSYTRKYEALDPSPLGAMVKVLQQVEGRSVAGP